MPKQTINIGAAANDGTGTPLRDAMDICNDNFNELYDQSPILTVGDWWSDTVFGNVNAAAPDLFAGAAISSGTASTAIPTTVMDGIFDFGVFLRSSTTANGGYRWQTTQQVGGRFGTRAKKFKAVLTPLGAHTNVTMRVGFHDSVTNADAVDGAYFEIVNGVISAKTASNSVRTTNATTFTMTLNSRYTFEIDVNAAGTSARFRVFENNNETPVLDVTNATNIPTGTARTFGAGLVATESTTTAFDMCVLWYMGVGTVPAYQRATGRT
jgi:hypothetical protein